MKNVRFTIENYKHLSKFSTKYMLFFITSNIIVTFDEFYRISYNLACHLNTTVEIAG